MKNIIILITLILSLDTFAKPVVMDVISAEFAVEDQNHNKSLCLTVVRVPGSGELLGLVESVQDCFYARKAKKAASLKIDLNAFRTITMPDLKAHLQAHDTQLKFYFSEGE
jgi:hypothetical protein